MDQSLQPSPPLHITQTVDIPAGMMNWYQSMETPDRGKVKVSIDNPTAKTRYFKIHIEEIEAPCEDSAPNGG